MDYSKTVNLPESDFPMKASLPTREPEMLKKWEQTDLYNRIQKARDGREKYVLHDGPPYANGHIHMGHALNKVLKDFIVKHKTMMGFQAPYVPGWDCHGLPIELNVTKKLGNKARDMDKVTIRKGCRDYAEEFVSIQMDEFKRLGVLGEYSNPYKTLSRDYEAKIVSVFGEILEKGFIYRSKKPIYWCPSCVTALAEAEVEYDDHTSTSIYVKFPVASHTVAGLENKTVSVVIWTTTPWTLPANLAVSFHPDFPYAAYRFNDEYLVLAEGMIEQFESETGLKHADMINLSRDDLDTMKVMHPFIERESRIIYGDHVTLEQGTGIVHTAPGHGHEDYVIGLQYDLEVFCPVDDHGLYTDDFPMMKGEHIFKANDSIVELLNKQGSLIKSSTTEHSYPHCWRCKKPLIFRATEQWFFSIDHDNLRDRAKKVVDTTSWVPSWGESRFRGMIENRPDWCLSRQRSWGVPIPSFTCTACGKNNMSPESVKHFADISMERSIDAWYTDDIHDLIPKGTTCSCGSTEFEKDFDILDVWFDSGVSHLAVLDARENLQWPADLYLEGSDQHRGWFQSSLWPALALKNQAPYKEVLTHGFLLDENGKAMSKSMGNVIPPDTIINQYGADILRLWVSSEDYRSDLRIGMTMVKQIADSYRKIRNTFKFILGNLSDYNTSDAISYDELSDLDKWILHKLHGLFHDVIRHYENHEFHLVYRKILNFSAVELSSIYFDITKDILYVEKKDSKERRSVQTVLHEISQTLVRLMAPVLPFTADEIWTFMGNEQSVHLEEYHVPNEQFSNPDISSHIDALVKVKEDVLKALEGLRKEKIIRSSLEAEISIKAREDNTANQLEELGSEMKRFFQVASVEIKDTQLDDMTEYDTVFLSARKTDKKKCVRCWNFYESLGSDKDHPDICERCTQVVTSL